MQSGGRFHRNNRYNKDQVPLPFVVSLSDTYEEKGTKEVWIKQNQAGLDKRFCSLELCFGPGTKQMKPGIVFLGKGTRISPVEKATNGKYTRAIICPYMAAPGF